MSTTLETALQWYDAGYLPIPFVHGSKRPLVKWTKYLNGTPRPTRAQVRRWFSRPWRVSPQGVNLALVCGVGSLVCLDFDHPAPFFMWRRKHPDIKTRVTRTPRPGYHVWFKVRDMSSVDGVTFADGAEVKSHSTCNDAPGCNAEGVEYQPWVACDVLEVQSIQDVTDTLTRGACYARSNGKGEEVPALAHSFPPLHFARVARNTAKSRTRRVDFSEVRKAVPILDLLKTCGCEFTPSGGDYFVTLCPFHEDHNPSFWCNTASNRCGCFRTDCDGHKAMDVIALVARLQNVSYRDAAIALKDW